MTRPGWKPKTEFTTKSPARLSRNQVEYGYFTTKVAKRTKPRNIVSEFFVTFGCFVVNNL
jgi:hypothetical protein